MKKIDFFTKEAQEFIWEMDEDWDYKDISFEGLQKKLSQIKPKSFMDYIRKYIYWAIFQDQPYESITDKLYVEEAKKAFKDNNMYDKVSSDDWFRNQFRYNAFTASRETVFTWAFGLNMDVEVVSMLLTKGIREQDFYFKNPYEIICHYCLKKKLPYDYVEYLIDEYVKRIKNCDYDIITAENSKGTQFYMNSFARINDDETLLQELIVLTKELKLQGLKVENINSQSILENKYTSNSVRMVYNMQLDQYKEVLVEKFSRERWDGINEIETHDSLEDAQKKDKTRVKKRDREDITNGEILESLEIIDEEQVDSILREDWVNTIVLNWGSWILKTKVDKNVLANYEEENAVIHRNHIITFVFLNFCFKYGNDPELRDYSLYDDFEDEVNDILLKCNMQPFYLPNPFEAFIAICLLSEDPEKTYKVVMKRVSEEREHKRKK